MRHINTDFDQSIKDLGNQFFQVDEPVFILAASDPWAPHFVDLYADMLESRLDPDEHVAELAEGFRQLAEDMRTYYDAQDPVDQKRFFDIPSGKIRIDRNRLSVKALHRLKDQDPIHDIRHLFPTQEERDRHNAENPPGE